MMACMRNCGATPCNCEVEVECQPCGGGDQAFVHAVNCLSGCNDPFPCLFCEAPRELMKCNDDEQLAAFRARTVERIELMAHTRVGKCPACNFSNTEETIAELAKSDRAGIGYPARWQGTRAEWLRLHCSVQYGRKCLLGTLAVNEWVLCLLHANLAVVRGLWAKTVIPFIDQAKGPVAGQRKKQKAVAKVAADEPQGQQIFAVMKSYGIPIKLHTLEKASKNVDSGRVYMSTMMCQKFTGDGSRKLLHGGCEAACKVFDIIAPNVLAEDKERNKYLRALWLAWYCVWQHLNGNVKVKRIRFKLDGELILDHEQWERFDDDGLGGVKRAAFVAKFQEKFNIFFVLWNSKHASEGLYLHILRAHAADQMLRYGSLVPFQIQGLEHCNSRRKGRLKKTTKKNTVVVCKGTPKRPRQAITGVASGRVAQVLLSVATSSYLETSEARSDVWVKSQEANERGRERKRFKVESSTTIATKLEFTKKECGF
jgi:hypothetical protein